MPQGRALTYSKISLKSHQQEISIYEDLHNFLREQQKEKHRKKEKLEMRLKVYHV